MKIIIEALLGVLTEIAVDVLLDLIPGRPSNSMRKVRRRRRRGKRGKTGTPRAPAKGCRPLHSCLAGLAFGP